MNLYVLAAPATQKQTQNDIFCTKKPYPAMMIVYTAHAYTVQILVKCDKDAAATIDV